MDGKFNVLCEKVRRAFDWTPLSVSLPRAEYRDYRDAGRVLLGFTVVVEYKYHGKQSRLFACDEDKLGLVSRERAYANAVNFYERMQDKVKER